MSVQPEGHRGGGGGAATASGVEFQKSVGTLFAAGLLSGRAVDSRLGLGSDARAAYLAMEQQDLPVDDILVATSNGGYVAVQAKTGLTLSRKPGSRFHDTVAQFVKHWRVCAKGAGKQGWDRPLDPAIDRLVVAVDPKSASTVRSELPAALRHLCSPGPTSLNAAEQSALATFQSCVETAWADATGEAPAPGFAAKLAQVVRVFGHDPSDRDRIEPMLEQASPHAADASSVLTALEAVVGDMMGSHGSADLAGLRSRLMSMGVALAPRRAFAKDVRALREHSRSTALRLQGYEKTVLLPDSDATMPRECQPSVNQAALDGSLLVVGEAGIGKSAVLSALARNLRDGGRDVVQLAVDRHSVRTVEGLGQELGLEHDLVEVLNAWDGTEPGWLLFDGLDAARGGETERAIRILIKKTLELEGRWRVVASIRTFDLHMGEELRRLFQGDAPVETLRDSKLAGVRHVSVPAWTDAEFAGLCERSPVLQRALANAPEGLRELARVPFNTNLIGELLNDGVDAVRLGEVTSQAQLLRLYWDRRIASLGTPAQACIFRTVEEMVRCRALRAAKHKVNVPQPQAFDDLSSVGVLTAGRDDAWAQFRHHVLFDFAAARWLLTHDTFGAQTHLLKTSANGLLLAPAMRFALNELWEMESDRTPFWSEVEPMLTDDLLDPVIRAAVARVAAELPSGPEDLAPVVNQVEIRGSTAAAALQSVASALLVAMEDDPGICIAPWAAALSDMAPSVNQVADVFRRLLHKFAERAESAQVRKEVGIAARALLRHALDEESSFLSRQAIGFVTSTYDTAPNASRQLLRTVFDDSRFERFGHDEVPALCDGAKHILESDPEFVAEIYRLVYGREVTEDRETSMSPSQILSLLSTARQDYGTAHYLLEELFGDFLAAHPKQAIEAVNGAVLGHLSRSDPIPKLDKVHDFIASGRRVRLREDRSMLWASDPQESYGESAPTLVVKLLETLKSCDENLAIEIADTLTGSVSLAIFWSRAFAAAAARGDRLLEFMLPYAIGEPFLLAYETRKDAIDVVATGYDRMSVDDREAFERRVLSMDFARFSDRASQAKRECLEALFGAIGRDRLATEPARQTLTDQDGNPLEGRPNPRRYPIESGGWPVEVDGSDQPAGTAGGHESDASSAEAAIRAAKRAMGPGSDGGQPFSGTFDEACDLLEQVERRIRIEGIGDDVVRRGEGAIGEGCLAISKSGLLAAVQDEPRIERFVRLLKTASSSEWPEVGEETEARFEKRPSWEPPAPRVDAAGAATYMVQARPDWFTRISDDWDRLLEDPHPAVRFFASGCLGLVWNSDPAGFRARLSNRIQREKNASVLQQVLDGALKLTIRHDPEFAEPLVLDLLRRSTGGNKAQLELRSSLAKGLATLWVVHERAESLAAIEVWIRDSAVHHRSLSAVLSTLREGYTHGLLADGAGGEMALRNRCHELALRVAKAAAEDFTSHAARAKSDEAEADLAGHSARLLDEVCRGIRSSVVKDQGQDGVRNPPDPDLVIFLGEATPTLECLADTGTPHTIYGLFKVLEYLLPLDPAKVFDIAVRAVLGGGKRGGFQFESMGADELVKMVGRLLADHRQIFDDEGRRQKLVQCLELFASVGWPSAARLLYRLPEAFR